VLVLYLQNYGLQTKSGMPFYLESNKKDYKTAFITYRFGENQPTHM
jgi:hypothetical protein